MQRYLKSSTVTYRILESRCHLTEAWSTFHIKATKNKCFQQHLLRNLSFNGNSSFQISTGHWGISNPEHEQFGYLSCIIRQKCVVLSLFSKKWEFKISKAMEQVWKIHILGKKAWRNPVWFPGKTRTWHRPRASEPHCSWSISLHPSPRWRISGQFVNSGELCHRSKLVLWVTQEVFPVALWPQVSDVMSTKFW